MTRIVVPFPVPAERAYAYLADPANRPQWQSSLRSVDDVVTGPDGDRTAAGVTWTDVTVVPGVRPRMETTAADRPRRWAEVGRFGPFSASLTLTFEEVADDAARCVVVAEFAVRGLGIGTPVTLGSRSAVRADLRRAAALAAGHG